MCMLHVQRARFSASQHVKWERPVDNRISATDGRLRSRDCHRHRRQVLLHRPDDVSDDWRDSDGDDDHRRAPSAGASWRCRRRRRRKPLVQSASHRLDSFRSRHRRRPSRLVVIVADVDAAVRLLPPSVLVLVVAAGIERLAVVRRRPVKCRRFATDGRGCHRHCTTTTTTEKQTVTEHGSNGREFCEVARLKNVAWES